MKTASIAQARVRDHGSLSLLVVAPAGCGKTEALAMRVAGLLQSGRITPPQRVLAVTFTNRARDNIDERLREHLSYGTLRDHVTVANFHGLAGRIIRAHGNVIGLDPAIITPDADWVRQQCHEHLGTRWDPIFEVERVLRVTKQQAIDDAAVAAALADSGNTIAARIEAQRLLENRATYDDVLRYAELILANEVVAGLYKNHFGAVIVDEYQDLTEQQFRVLNLVGDGNITYAGDLAQGIYSFTGANPAAIHASISATCDDTVEFNESHRSSPAVLSMVNAMNSLTGGTNLECAVPESWPGGGLAGRRTFDTAEAEARWITKLAEAILARAPSHRIGVMTRVKSRLRFVDEHLAGTGLEVHRWEDGYLDTETAKIVRALLRRLDVAALVSAPDQLAYLRNQVDWTKVEEPDTRRSLIDALAWVLERLEEGLAPSDVRARIRVGDQTTLLNAPGVHVLSGHVGKGQQFDWAFVLGGEEGNIPFFKADSAAEITEEARILGVMISRARHGVVVTAASWVRTLNGIQRERPLSQFWHALDAADPFEQERMIAWLKAAPWGDIAIR